MININIDDDILKILSSPDILSLTENSEQNIELREQITVKFIDYIKSNIYGNMKNVLMVISAVNLLKILDVSTFKKGFHNNGEEYKFFASLLNKRLNPVIEYCLSNNLWLQELLMLNNYYFSCFENITYENLRNIILRINEQHHEEKYSTMFLTVVSKNFQRDIIKENISLKTLKWLLKCVNEDVQSDFFATDERAIQIYKEFDIVSLINNNICFNNKILSDDYFFEQVVKDSDSFVSFRTIINKLEAHNNIDIVEEHLQKFYKRLLVFDEKEELFKEYREIFENPELLDLYYARQSFIVDSDVKNLFRKHVGVDDDEKLVFLDKEQLLSDLKMITNKKTSDIICDMLFKDNYYNVCLNIKEMLRYNEHLDDKVIPQDREQLYKLILNFDMVSLSQKMQILNKYQRMHIMEYFYDDIRILKNISYMEL